MIDFSKMTKEKYEIIENARIELEKEKRNLALRKAELNCLDNSKCSNDLKVQLNEMINDCNEMSIKLKEYEI